MNKLGYFIVILGVILLIALSAFVIMSIGTNIDVEIVGVRYQLGKDNIEYEESITLKFKGKYVNSFFNHVFIGDVNIDGHKLNELNNSKTTLKFDKYNRANLYDTNYNHVLILTDFIFINDDFSKVAICISEPSDDDPNSSHWDSGTGIMMAAPASNREQALAISNEVMDSFLPKEMK